MEPNRSLENQTFDDECFTLKHDSIEVKFALLSVVGSAIAIFGIFGNITTVLIMRRSNMRHSSNHLYLTSLAVFDTLVLMPSILLYSMEPVSEYFNDEYLYAVWIRWVPHCFALSHFAQTGSVYITLSATFERYLAVLYPKYADVRCTKHKTMLIIVGVTCFAAVFNCTKFLEIVVAHYENCSGFAAYELVPSALLRNSLYSVVYTLWLSQFIMVFLPFGVLLTANTAIVFAFRRSLKRVKREEHRKISVKPRDGSEFILEKAALKEQSRDATRVLATIVGAFLICNCLGFVVTLLESVYGPMQLATWAPRLYDFSRDAINFLAIVNSSINFVVCCTFGKDFRRELAAMCGLESERRRVVKNAMRLRPSARISQQTSWKWLEAATESLQQNKTAEKMSAFYRAQNDPEPMFTVIL